MSLLLACLFTTLPGCAADNSVGPASMLASLSVAVDSTTLSVGHVAQLSITAKDSSGNIIVQPASWTSMTPHFASVSSSGAVTAIASGEAVIEGRVLGSTATARLTIVAAADLAAPNFADLAAHNFDDGSIGPFTNPWGIDLDFPSDPTASGRGKVARFHYHGTSDQNRAILFSKRRGWGEPLHFRGEFYLPLTDLGAEDVIRKLIYWQPHNDYNKYRTNGGLATGRTVVLISGTDLVVDATYNPAPETGRNANDVRTVEVLARGIRGNKWYALEVFQQMETAIGRADGVLKVWLDGQLVFSKTTMTWSDPAWVGNTSNGVPFEASDIYFEHFLVGDQVNWPGAYDEYRYWDNVEFSTRRR